MPDAVIVSDREYRVVYASRAVKHNLSMKTPQACIIIRCSTAMSRALYCWLECPVRAIFATSAPSASDTLAYRGRQQDEIHEIAAFPISIGYPPLIAYAGLIVKENGAFSDERLVHIGKMAALGTMLIHIVHNLNSSMYVINNYIRGHKKTM